MAFIHPSIRLPFSTHTTFSSLSKSSRRSISMTGPATTPCSTSLPPRKVLDPLPNLYVYDHCPYCVRVRLALGYKNVKYNLIWLSADDFDTPVSLVGTKMTPIFQPDGADGEASLESLDIIEMVDSDPKFGAVGTIRPDSGREDLDHWLGEVLPKLKRLTRPRYVVAPIPEVVFKEAREFFANKYPLFDPDGYEENFKRSGEYVKFIQGKLEDLEKMMWSTECISEGGFSLDDIKIFPFLRAMTIVKGLELKGKVGKYVKTLSETAEVPLYFHCAS